MSNFRYSALDAAGKSVAGVTDAHGRSEAIAELASRRIFVTEIAQCNAEQDGEHR